MMLRIAALAVFVLLLSGCGATVTTEVVPVQIVLPEQERAVYRVENKSGDEIGRAVFLIASESDGLLLTQEYRFAADQLDRSSVLVDRESMRPRTAMRLVEDGSRRYETSASYNDALVRVVSSGEHGERRREAEISEATYDNLESLFLWRTIEMGAGEQVRYVNVVVDPKRGTISRALATLEVSGRETVPLPGGEVEAWRVDFTSAGVTNSAWYAVDGDRRLVKYAIARGPTLLLESISH